MEPIRLFIGDDPREAGGLYAFLESLKEFTHVPVSLTIITAKVAQAYGVVTDGTNDFSKARFLPPFLCGFRGRSIWLDGADMMLRTSLANLWGEWDGFYGVKVVKHDYTPKHARKYIGTEMESDNVAYPRKNWSSVIVWANDNMRHRVLTPEFIAKQPGSYLHRFEWMDDERIGALQTEWNWLDEYGENEAAKIVHYTNGIPGFAHYREAPHAAEWWEMQRKSQRGIAA